jgi:glycosyltransferase involved in cell wall biosynthesis
VQEFAAACGVLDQIRPLGHQDARCVLWASDTLVLPSNEEEAFGLVVIEAMCCGVPVTRSATGGHEEQIQHGVTGFSFPPNDDAMLARHLRHLYSDVHARAKVARAGQQFARTRFTQAQMVDAVCEVYAGVLRQKDAT